MHSSKTTKLDVALLKLVVYLTRPYNALAAILSFVIGYYLFEPLGIDNLIIGIISVALVHSAATVQNDIYDIAIDKDNKRKSGLISGKISRQFATNFVLYASALAILVSVYSDDKYVGFFYAVAFIVLAWIYNSPPLLLSRKPIPSIIILSFYYSLIPFMFGYTYANHSWTLSVVLFAVFLTCQRFSISILKDYKDKYGDQKNGKNTFLIRYGHRTVSIISNTFAIFGYISILILLTRYIDITVYSSIFFIFLLLFAASNVLLRIKLLKSGSLTEYARIFQQSFLRENYFNGMLALCLVLY